MMGSFQLDEVVFLRAWHDLEFTVDFSEICVAQCSFLCSVFEYHCLFFCPFLSAIALSALLIFTASDDSFGIFKLYLADGGHLE